MNWLYIVVMAYIVLSALRGFHKGFIRVVYSMASLLVTCIFVALAVPLAGSLLLEYTPVYTRLEDVCEDYIRSQAEEKIKDGTIFDSPKIAGYVLPKTFQEELAKGTEAAAAEFLESQGIYQKAAKAAAGMIVAVVSFFVSLILIRVVLYFIGRKLNLFSKLPGVHLLNMILGFAAGAVKAFIVIWAVFLLIKVTAFLPASASMIKLIEADGVLKSLYEENLLLEFLQKISPSIG